MIYILLPLSLAAFYTVYLLWIPMRRSLHARHWPSHLAKVVDSNLTRQSTRLGEVYTLRVRVAYTVDEARTTDAALPSPFGTSREGYTMRLAQFFTSARPSPSPLIRKIPASPSYFPASNGETGLCSV